MLAVQLVKKQIIKCWLFIWLKSNLSLRQGSFFKNILTCFTVQFGPGPLPNLPVMACLCANEHVPENDQIIDLAGSLRPFPNHGP